MSISSGKVWLSELMVTVTFWTVPTPETVMFDGYGFACPIVPLPGMRIGVELVKLTGGHVGVGVAVGVAVGVGVGPHGPVYTARSIPM
jgi:hypothetical protein